MISRDILGDQKLWLYSLTRSIIVFFQFLKPSKSLMSTMSETCYAITSIMKIPLLPLERITGNIRYGFIIEMNLEHWVLKFLFSGGIGCTRNSSCQSTKTISVRIFILTPKISHFFIEIRWNIYYLFIVFRIKVRFIHTKLSEQQRIFRDPQAQLHNLGVKVNILYLRCLGIDFGVKPYWTNH